MLKEEKWGRYTRGGMPHPLLVAIPLLLVVLALAILPAWLKTCRALAEYYGREVRYRWLEGPPVEPGEKSAAYTAELEGLGYSEAGWLQPEGSVVFFRVLIHRELPIYALLAHAADSSGVYAVVPQLESFLAGCGRVSTTGSPDFGRMTGSAGTEAPRLVQLRVRGPVTPTALDGQHVGTVRAWLAGGRELLPAGREALPGYLEQDHRCLGAALERAGWVRLPAFLRAMAGRAPGVLPF